MPICIRSSLLFWFLIGFSQFSLAELELEPNNEITQAMTITSGLKIEASTDDVPANQSADGDPDFFLIEVDNEEQPSGITIRIDGDDCLSCKAINFSLIDKESLTVIVAENTEQSTTRSKQLIQQEYNITGDAYLKIISSGINQSYDLTVWVNDGLHYSAEVEPNDGKNSDTYNYLPNGREFQGNISDISDDDWIRFTPTLPVASFQVTAEGCDHDGTPESQDCSATQPSVAWAVFRGNDQVRTGNTASDTTNQTRAFEIPISPEHINNDHYIKFYSDHVFAELDGESWSNRTYSVTYYEVSQAEEEFETEPNNDGSKANTIVSGTTYEGNISESTTVSSPGDLDYYLIDVVSDSSYSGVTVRLEADDSNTAKAVHFELRDKMSDVLIASENAEQTVVNSSEQVVEAKYNIQGDAYLRVFSNQTGQYYKLTVFVDESSAHLAEYEPNDTSTVSKDRPLFPNGKRLRGNLSADNDIDFFKIDNPGGKATFFITTEGCDIDGFGEGDSYLNNSDKCSSLKVSLLTSDEETISTVLSEPGTANQVKSLSANLPQGVSYLKVESEHEFSRLQNTIYQNRTYELVGFLPAAPRVTITSSAGLGGAISPAGKSTVQLKGTKTFVATPDANYFVNEFTDNCDAQNSRVGNTYTISEVTKDCNVTVTFTPLITITASSSDGGSISPEGEIKIASGVSQTFTASAASGFHFEYWTGSCPKTYSALLTSVEVNSSVNCTINAQFSPIITITASSSDGGSISPEGEIKIASGVSQTFTASAASGFHFENWTGSCPKTYVALLTSVEVNSSVNCTINAQFSLTPVDDIFVTITSIGYPVSFSVPGKNIVDSTGSTEVKIEQYSNLTLTFNHEPQWNLTQELAITGCGILLTTGNIYIHTLTSVTESCELKVNLRDKLKFDFLMSIGKGASLNYLSASGTVSGTKVGPLADELLQIGQGETVTFTATVEAPYVIDRIISCFRSHPHEFVIYNFDRDCVIRIETSSPSDSDGDGIDDSNDYDDDNDGVPDSEDSEPLNPQIPFTARHIVVYAKFNGGWDGDIATKGPNGFWDWEFGVENTSLVDVDIKLVSLWAHNADGENTKRMGFSERPSTAGDGILQAGESSAQIFKYSQGNWDSALGYGGPIHSPASIEVTFTHPDTGDTFSKIAKFTSQGLDLDGDGVLDLEDVFPTDPDETLDSDGDGIGNNHDNCVNVVNYGQVNTDSDETGDKCDGDDDNDGVLDASDFFPLDSSESADTDSDGMGNNADTDDDGDSVLDVNDAFPQDASESMDTDGDGVGNNSDWAPYDSTESADTDGDGVGNNADAFPIDASETSDMDGDGTGDNTDSDIDGDGVSNSNDPFPNQGQYKADSDGDGMPDAWETKYGLDSNDPSDASSDQDNDGVSAYDEFIAGTIPAGSLDIDGNGQYDALTDGLLLLRGMFLLSGDSLISDAVASDAVYKTSDEVASRIDMLGDLVDIDGNGSVDALTDGLLILRYLFNLRGDVLINDVIASDATVKTAEDVEGKIEGLVPTL